MQVFAETTAALQSETKDLGVTLNKQSVMVRLSQHMASFETVRDSGVDVVAQQWKTHCPPISMQAGVARTKATELCSCNLTETVDMRSNAMTVAWGSVSTNKS
jgi:hypothetical protein